MKTIRQVPPRSSSLRRVVTSIAVASVALGAARSAQAAGLNDPTCKPTALRPYPAVVVHGQGGAFEGMAGVTNALVTAGYCVYARNYGKVPGGANGQDHLGTSAGQIGAFVDQVLTQTGAKQVDVIGHSAGTGVLDNYILKRGGAAKVHRMVSFGGLHHPYAHVGLAKAKDASIFLPNLIGAARRVLPGITTTQIVKTALGLYASAGAPLGPIDPALVATMESNFTSDLFDPEYWKDLHGGPSEKATVFIRVGTSERTLPTKDSAPTVCYTNIVAAADLLAGAAAGFQDEATNVDNFLDVTTLTQNAHNDMLTNPLDLVKMVTGLSAPCVPGVPKPLSGDLGEEVPASADDVDAASDFEEAVMMSPTGTRTPLGADTGCSVSTVRDGGGRGWAGLAGVGLALGAALARRRRVASRH